MREICENAEEFFAKLKDMRTCAAEADLHFRTVKADSCTARKVAPLDIGSEVYLNPEHMIDEQHVSGKLDSDWVGPHVVVGLVPPNSFVLQHVRSGKRTNPVHLRKLTQHFANDDEDLKNAADEDEDEDARPGLDFKHGNNAGDANCGSEDIKNAPPLADAKRRSSRNRKQAHSVFPMPSAFKQGRVQPTGNVALHEPIGCIMSQLVAS